MAYETLSEGLKKTLDGLIGINTSSRAHAFKKQVDRLSDAGPEQEVIVGAHPVVRTHPETGRKALYVNINHTKYFQGWTASESRPVLDYPPSQTGVHLPLSLAARFPRDWFSLINKNATSLENSRDGKAYRGKTSRH